MSKTVYVCICIYMIIKKTVYLSDDTHRKIKIYAVKNGISMTDAIEKLTNIAFSFENSEAVITEENK